MMMAPSRPVFPALPISNTTSTTNLPVINRPVLPMPALIYIHGFLSSPRSWKAQQVQQWLAQNRPDIRYHCPHLTPYPDETRQALETLVESLLPEPVYLMGSSLGGFWASWLAEKYD